MEYRTQLERDLDAMQAEAEQHTQDYDDAAVLRVVEFCRAVLKVAARDVERRLIEGEPTCEPCGLIAQNPER